jgi:predicted RNase H-like HicB family nuclease
MSEGITQINGRRIILSQEADGGYVVVAPSLPGCISQGDTQEKALHNIRDAIEGYIAVLIEDGDPIPPIDGQSS